jgi:acyl carrier protein
MTEEEIAKRDRQEDLRRLCSMVADQGSYYRLQPDTTTGGIEGHLSFGQIGLDLLDVLELSLTVEEKFGVEIPEEIESQLTLDCTVNKFLDLIYASELV